MRAIAAVGCCVSSAPGARRAAPESRAERYFRALRVYSGREGVAVPEVSRGFWRGSVAARLECA
jgi:hypothetical protein